MTIHRQLEDIVANLDDMSVALEEIKDQGVPSDAADRLNSLDEQMTRAADVIEEALESGMISTAE